MAGAGGSNYSRKVRSSEDFDVIIGLVCFWGLVCFVLTLALELTGRPDQALLPAFGLAAAVLALWALVRLRKRLPARRARRPT